MPFSENLRAARRMNNLSQEQLAESLNVSRQAVSKWELGEGYPETENLIQLAGLLAVSLDFLLLDRRPAAEEADSGIKPHGDSLAAGQISILSHDGTTLAAYREVVIMKMVFPSKKQPKCLLGGKQNNWWGGITTLGWYASMEDAKLELEQIHRAMQNGEPSYQLKHHVTVRGRVNPKIVY